jgi:hypothetical protein
VSRIKNIAEWMAELGVSVETLVDTSSLDPKIVRAIVSGQYTASPRQRQRLAVALGIEPEQIAWAHTTPVEQMYGHGPQFGRSP